jgi:hypothetical protein
MPTRTPQVVLWTRVPARPSGGRCGRRPLRPGLSLPDAATPPIAAAVSRVPLSLRVRLVNVLIRAREASEEPSSLKAICPSVPIPRI